MLPANLEKAVLGYAATIAESISYVGAGTVEFIFDLERNEVYFMEMNTRLQVEHPVTEAVTGLDIVMAQFRIAAGESIDSMVPGANGYSMELRINAEKPSNGADGTLSFVPCPGEVTKFHFPNAPGISMIRAVDEGRMVTPYYDGMIVQLIVHAPDRKKAIRTLREYLDKVEIQGICTNIPLLKRILDDKIFTKGIYDTTYLKEFTSRLDTISLTKEMEDAAGLEFAIAGHGCAAHYGHQRTAPACPVGRSVLSNSISGRSGIRAARRRDRRLPHAVPDGSHEDIQLSEPIDIPRQ